MALFAEMLSLPNDGHYPAIVLTPEQHRQRTLEALTEHLAGLASQNPVLMIFEDAHWTDPTSLEAFGRTVDGIRTLPVLLIVTGGADGLLTHRPTGSRVIVQCKHKQREAAPCGRDWYEGTGPVEPQSER